MPGAGTPAAPRSPRRGPGAPQRADLVLFYILIFLHAAVMATLPAAVWRLLAWVRAAPGVRLPRGLVPALLATAALAEIWLGWRLRRIWRRVRRGSPPA
jgi:hypothetical protein